MRYRGVVRAKPGELLYGFAKRHVSVWFNTRQEAEDWLYAIKTGYQADKIESTEVQERE